VTVNPVDDNPIANNDTSSTNEDVNVIIDITNNDTDSDGTIDDSTLDLDPNTPGQQSVFTVPGEGTFTDNGNGTVTFDPVPGFNNGITTITYTVNDDAGNTSNEAVISVTIPPCPSALDSDGDGLTDCEETTGIDDPSTPDDPTTFPGGPTSDPNDPCIQSVSIQQIQMAMDLRIVKKPQESMTQAHRTIPQPSQVAQRVIQTIHV
ncbi:Ig-like domain-containing protein, partial [Jejuia pallidilutea]|uniref:Ig-like domain-containing protein n=1 Tax=Jejuia pallidilutea TaxID=504487 RepID=UPI0005AA1833